MIVLGIETSCDETAAAVVSGTREILADRVRTQIEDHHPYGGVVPEIAARAHIEHLDRLIDEAMSEAGVSWFEIDAIAATSGPGLIGGLMVGLTSGKALAAALAKPFIAVNHLEAHALSARLTDGIEFPYLLLLVSGGHCQLLIVKDVGQYVRLGTTVDDAVGEAFDKAAKLMNLGYPGGPAIERAAKDGDPTRFDMPRPMLGRDGCHFSFSGLKTALRYKVRDLTLSEKLSIIDIADLAAGFQAAVADVLVDRSRHAIQEMRARYHYARTFVVAGGVAANQSLRARLSKLAEEEGFTLVVPPPALCTDNGAMVAWAGLERFSRGLTNSLAEPPRARWPLDPDAAKAPGAGARG
jgi:N6-L-threonylcarbamoyladenine synthase